MCYYSTSVYTITARDRPYPSADPMDEISMKPHRSPFHSPGLEARLYPHQKRVLRLLLRVKDTFTCLCVLSLTPFNLPLHPPHHLTPHWRRISRRLLPSENDRSNGTRIRLYSDRHFRPPSHRATLDHLSRRLIPCCRLSLVSVSRGVCSGRGCILLVRVFAAKLLPTTSKCPLKLLACKSTNCYTPLGCQAPAAHVSRRTRGALS